MQVIIRAVLSNFGIPRVRVFDSVEPALESMLAEAPNLIVTDWRMEPTSGYQLLRMIRHKHMAPLCFVPVLFITSFGTRALVDKALRAGAHMLLVKPISPTLVHDRLRWILRDSRPMVVGQSGFVGIGQPGQRVEAIPEVEQTIEKAREKHLAGVKRVKEIHGMLDRFFGQKNDGEEEKRIMEHAEAVAARAERAEQTKKAVTKDLGRVTKNASDAKNKRKRKTRGFAEVRNAG
ncbi:response regulator [Roseibium sediminis]|uniref:response regulator n=1 Tax=Roseibium sediminis TaxID=1775174 RepID=UPI001AD8E4EC